MENEEIGAAEPWTPEWERVREEGMRQDEANALREAERWEIEREMEQDWRNGSEYEDGCYDGCSEEGPSSSIAPFMGDQDAFWAIAGSVVVYGIILMFVVALISKMCQALVNRIKTLRATRRVARSPK